VPGRQDQLIPGRRVGRGLNAGGNGRQRRRRRLSEIFRMASVHEALGPLRKEARMSFRLTGNPRFRAHDPRNSLGRDSECTHAGPSSLPAIAVAATAGTGASRLVPGTIYRLEHFAPKLNQFCLRAVRRSVRRQAQRDAAHRASLPTQRAPAARKPAKSPGGPGGFAPMPAGFGLAIAPLWPAPHPPKLPGALSQIHSGRMVQFGCKVL
jgi:hypothetical protein